MKFTFFKTQQPRRFRHIPIYYDERKEQLDELKRRAGVDTSVEDIPAGDENKRTRYMKGDLKARWTMNRIDSVKEESKKKNIRLILIIGVLLYIAYLISQSEMKMLDVFFK